MVNSFESYDCLVHTKFKTIEGIPSKDFKKNGPKYFASYPLLSEASSKQKGMSFASAFFILVSPISSELGSE